MGEGGGKIVGGWGSTPKIGSPPIGRVDALRISWGGRAKIPPYSPPQVFRSWGSKFFDSPPRCSESGGGIGLPPHLVGVNAIYAVTEVKVLCETEAVEV